MGRESRVYCNLAADVDICRPQKKDYAQAVRAFGEEIASACRQANIDYHPIDTATPFDKALYAFLAKRERLY